MHRSVFAPVLLLVCCTVMLAAHATGPTQRRLLAAPTAGYGAGWNLVSGPAGSTLFGATSLYTLQAGNSSYQDLNPNGPLQSGWGYWAYFPNGGALQPSPDAQSASTTLIPGTWIMLGDPSATQPAVVIGADSVLLYSATAGYQTVSSIPPGQGAFVTGSGTVSLSVSQPVVPGVPSTTPPVLGVAAIAMLGLKQTDLPGFSMRGATGGVPPAGGVAAYVQSWRDLRLNTTHFAVDESLLSYQSVAAAAGGMQALLQQLQLAPNLIGLQQLGSAGIGDADQELSYASFAPNGAALDVNVVIFRDATLVVEITTFDFQGDGSLSIALGYARIVAGRAAVVFGH